MTGGSGTGTGTGGTGTGITCTHYWTTSRQNQQNDPMARAPSEDTDQPGHLPSLISIFAVRMNKHWVLSYQLSAQRRLWSDWADAQADLSLRWSYSHFVGFVMRWLILTYMHSGLFYAFKLDDFIISLKGCLVWCRPLSEAAFCRVWPKTRGRVWVYYVCQSPVYGLAHLQRWIHQFIQKNRTRK